MPLINLQTDLKSLKYGGDRLNGGDSPQPFIKIDIPPQNQSTTDVIPPSVGTGGLQNVIPTLGPLFNNPVISGIRTLVNAPLQGVVGLGIGNNESIIRGGLSSAVRSGIDAIRITRFLTTPQGLIFITKQNLLAGSGVKTEGSGALINDKPYSPLGTLGQSLGNAFGLHTLKQGLNPLAGVKNRPKPNNYLDAVDPDIVLGYDKEKDNRLVVLKDAIDSRRSKRYKGTKLNGNLGTNVINYKGGPGSVLGLGLGRTTIGFADPNQRTGRENPNLIKSGFFRRFTPARLNVFTIGEVAEGAASFINNNTQNFPIGSIGDILSPFIPNLFDRVQDEVRGEIFGGFGGLENLGPQSSFSVFKQREDLKTTLDFRNYVRLSNVYASAFGGFPNLFNEKVNKIKGDDGTRIETLGFNVYKDGNGDISKNTKLIDKNKGSTLSQEQIREAAFDSSNLISTFSPRGEIQEDFRKEVIRRKTNANNDVPYETKTVLSISPSYKTHNFMKRANVGDPGAIPITRDGLENGVYDYSLPANALFPVNRISALEPFETLTRYNAPTNDLFTLRFAVINPNNANSKTYIQFPAYINNFSDNFSSNWNSVKYAGRADNFYNYTGFDRQISFGFTVTAESKAELVPMYRKLNYLASTLTPTYSTAGYMRGTILELTMGWYLRATPGFLTSLNYTVPQDSPYEINISGGETEGDGSYIDDNTVGELPLIINVEATFTPIHDFIPELAADSNGAYTNNPNARFISLRDGERSGSGNDLYGDGRGTLEGKLKYIPPDRYSLEGEPDPLSFLPNPEGLLDNLVGDRELEFIRNPSEFVNLDMGGYGPVGNVSLPIPGPQLNTNSPDFNPPFVR